MSEKVETVKAEDATVKSEDNKVTLTKQEVNKSWWIWFKYCLTVFGYERLQAPGFTLSMLPISKKFYSKDPDKMVARLKCHSVFYNTNPVFGAMVNGIVASMEVERGNGAKITDDFINSIKVGLMGPLAGIGDAVTQATIPPIILSIAIGLSSGGSPLGAVFAVLGLYLSSMALSRLFYMQGYKSGREAVSKFLGKQMTKIQDAMSVLGLTVVGAITASYVNLTITSQYVSEYSTVKFQEILDGIFPKLIPMCLVFLGYYLLKKKKMSAVKLIGVYLVIAIVLGVLGIV